MRGKDFSEAYLEKYTKWEKTEDEYNRNRERIKDYLRQVFIGILTNNKYTKKE